MWQELLGLRNIIGLNIGGLGRSLHQSKLQSTGRGVLHDFFFLASKDSFFFFACNVKDTPVSK